MRSRCDPNIAAGVHGAAGDLREQLLNQLQKGADDASDAASTRGDADVGGSSDLGRHGESVPDSRASRLQVLTVAATLLSQFYSTIRGVSGERNRSEMTEYHSSEMENRRSPT